MMSLSNSALGTKKLRRTSSYAATLTEFWAKKSFEGQVQVGGCSGWCTALGLVLVEKKGSDIVRNKRRSANLAVLESVQPSPEAEK